MPANRITNPDLNITHDQIDSFTISPLVAGQISAKEYRTKMQIDGCTYRVQLKMDDGSVTVKREIGFLRGLFTKNYATSLKNRLQAQIPEFKNRRYWNDLNRASKESTVFALAKHFENDRNHVQEVAHYGFESIEENTVHARMNAARALKIHNKQNPNPLLGTKIDQYNLVIGITDQLKQKTMFMKQTLPQLLTKIRNGTLPPPGNYLTLDPDKVVAWKTLLQTQIEKVDIFSSIRKFIAEGSKPATETTKQSGWAHQVRTSGVDSAMQAYVRKNLPPRPQVPELTEAHISQIAKALKELALNTETKEMTESFMDSFMKSQFGQIPDTPLGPSALAFKFVTQIAFFRQTSKLGLEFFREQHVPVVFQCYTYKGKNLIERPVAGQKNSAGAIQLKGEVTNKWWYDPAARADLNRYQPITYSEMRHLSRLQESGKAPQVIPVRIEK